MAVLTDLPDSIRLFLRYLDMYIKAVEKLYDLSSQAGCPYLDDLAVVFKYLDSFRDKVLKDIDYENLRLSA